MENVKKVGFFKLGKSIKFNENSWGAIGGDCEPKQLINAIAKRNPNIEYLDENNKPKYNSELVESAKALQPLIKEKINKCMTTKKDKDTLLNDLFTPIEN